MLLCHRTIKNQAKILRPIQKYRILLTVSVYPLYDHDSKGRQAQLYESDTFLEDITGSQLPFIPQIYNAYSSTVGDLDDDNTIFTNDNKNASDTTPNIVVYNL